MDDVAVSGARSETDAENMTLSYQLKRLYPGLLLALVLTVFIVAALGQLILNTNSDALDQGAYLSLGLAAKEELRLTDPYRQPLLSWLLAPFAERDISYFTWAKLIVLTTGLLALLCCHFVALRLYRKPLLGVFSAFLLASNVFFIQESATVMVEPLLASLVLLTWFFGLKALTENRYRHWVLGGVTSALAYLGKESGLFWAAAWAVGAFAANGYRWKRYTRFAFFLAALLITLIPFLVSNRLHYGQFVLADSTSVVWLDDWEEFFTVGAGASVSFKEYLARHTWRDLLDRLGDGLMLTGALSLSVFAPFQVDRLAKAGLRSLCGDWCSTYGLPVTAGAVALVLACLFRRRLLGYCRAKGSLVAFTGAFLLMYVVGVAWLAPVTFDPRYIVPLLPMAYVMLGGLGWHVAQVAFNGRTANLDRLRGVFLAGLTAAILVWGFVTLGAARTKLDGVSRAHALQLVSLPDPFGMDCQANRAELAVVQVIEEALLGPRDADTVGAIVYQPSHDLPIWMIEGRAQVLFVPADVNWLQFVAYLRSRHAEYLMLTPELYLRRKGLFKNLFYPAWPNTESRPIGRRYLGIRALPAAWELVYAAGGFPSPYYIFRLSADTAGESAVYVEQGDAALASGDWRRAEEQYQAALSSLQATNALCKMPCQQSQARVYRTLSQMAALKNHHDQALNYIEKALALQPDSAWYHVIRGDLLDWSGQQSAAGEEYRQAMKLPGGAWANLSGWLAWVQAEQGQLEATIAGYRQALELSFEHPWYKAMLGRSLIEHGAPNKATALFQDILGQKIEWAFVRDWLTRASSTTSVAMENHPGDVLNISYTDGLLLRGYRIDPADYLRGGRIKVVLYWTPPAYAGREYRVYGKLVNAMYTVWGEGEATLQRRGIPPGSWATQAVLQDTLTVQVQLGTPPGDYRLTLDVREMIEPTWLNESPPKEVKLGPIELPARPWSVKQLDMTQTTDAVFGDRMKLCGYRLDGELRPGGIVHLTLFWQALQVMDTDYTVFTHLLDAEGNLRGQKDNQPADGFYPTSLWQPGEVVRDPYAIPISTGGPLTNCAILVGVYRAETGERLPARGDSVASAEDSVRIDLDVRF